MWLVFDYSSANMFRPNLVLLPIALVCPLFFYDYFWTSLPTVILCLALARLNQKYIYIFFFGLSFLPGRHKSSQGMHVKFDLSVPPELQTGF